MIYMGTRTTFFFFFKGGGGFLPLSGGRAQDLDKSIGPGHGGCGGGGKGGSGGGSGGAGRLAVFGVFGGGPSSSESSESSQSLEWSDSESESEGSNQRGPGLPHGRGGYRLGRGGTLCLSFVRAFCFRRAILSSRFLIPVFSSSSKGPPNEAFRNRCL